MTTPPFTLVTTCKPFTGPAAGIQRNAFGSWSRLQPRSEVLVFGDEPGVKDICQEFAFRHIPQVRQNEYGTPLVGDLIVQADREASSRFIALVNADIMLTDDLAAAFGRVLDHFDRFLLLVRRWNTPPRKAWSFDGSDWQSHLRAFARSAGSLEPARGGVDAFVYPRGLFRGIPSFAIGRGRWDSWLIAHARLQRVPVIDVSEVCLTVHQDHDYDHIRQDSAGAVATSPTKPSYEETPEGRRNEELLGGDDFIFTCLNATHRLRENGLRRNTDLRPAHLLRRFATLPALYPALRPLRPLIRRGISLWRNWSRSHHLAGQSANKERRRSALNG